MRDSSRRRGPRPIVGVLLALGLLAGGAPAAHASIWTGTCILELEFTFDPEVGPALTQGEPTYSIEVSQPVDLNPLTANVTEGCVISLSTGTPFRRTIASGEGSAFLWTCESVLAGGWWNQGWVPSLPPVFGSHLLTGTWGDWKMVVSNPSLSFSGVIELTLHPDEALALDDCLDEELDSLRMLGTMVFQDPQIPSP